MSHSSYMSKSKDREATLDETSQSPWKNSNSIKTPKITVLHYPRVAGKELTCENMSQVQQSLQLQLEWWLLHNCVVTEISPHRTVDPFYEAESFLIKVPLCVQ